MGTQGGGGEGKKRVRKEGEERMVVEESKSEG